MAGDTLFDLLGVYHPSTFRALALAAYSLLSLNFSSLSNTKAVGIAFDVILDYSYRKYLCMCTSPSRSIGALESFDCALFSLSLSDVFPKVLLYPFS